MTFLGRPTSCHTKKAMEVFWGSFPGVQKSEFRSEGYRRRPDYSSNLCPPIKYDLYDFLGGVLGLLPVLFFL